MLLKAEAVKEIFKNKGRVTTEALFFQCTSTMDTICVKCNLHTVFGVQSIIKVGLVFAFIWLHLVSIQ